MGLDAVRINLPSFLPAWINTSICSKPLKIHVHLVLLGWFPFVCFFRPVRCQDISNPNITQIANHRLRTLKATSRKRNF